MANYYYSGQGSLLMAVRDPVTGNPLGFLPVGNVPELTLNIEVSKFEHKESESGARLVDLSLVTEKKGTFEFTLENLSIDNLTMGLWGTQATVAGGSVTTGSPESIVLGKFQAGARYALQNPKVSAVILKDTTGTTTYVRQNLPATTGDYILDDVNGTIEPVAGGAIATATVATGVTVKAEYTFAGYTKVDAFTQAAAPERWLRFQGINTIDNSRVIVDLFRAQFDPLTGYGLINEELGSVTLAGTLLADSTRVTGSKFFAQRNVSA